MSNGSRTDSARPPIFLTGLVSAAAVVKLSTGFSFKLGYEFQVITGILLLALLVYQLQLLLLRLARKASGPEDLSRHRWAGVAAATLFFFHALSFGFGWTLALTACFIAVALSSLLAKRIVRYSNREVFLIRYALHIGLGCLCLALGFWHGVIAVMIE